MAESADFRARQYEFAAYIRDPDNQSAPADIEARRMTIYADLFFNNVRNFLGGHFPVLCELLGKERWAMLVRDYYRDHQSHSPLFPDMPREFLSYLEKERPSGKRTDEQADPPFMYELAHYEWVEAGLLMAEEKPLAGDIDPEGDMLEKPPALSSVAWLLSYAWPVNEIGKAHQPQEPAETPLHYLVYRDAADKVRFLRLNVVSARLFELLTADNSLSGRTALEQIAAELTHLEPEKVIESGASLLKQWREKDIVLGTFV
jgi:hypothetical protein